jgi:serine/threonine protein kinase
LKLDNIVLVDSTSLRVKIVDFGISGLKNQDKSDFGTLYYMAPEILKSPDRLSPPTDIWSMGIILYAMVYGSLPFKAKDRKEMREVIKKGIEFPSEPKTSDELKNFIR